MRLTLRSIHFFILILAFLVCLILYHYSPLQFNPHSIQTEEASWMDMNASDEHYFHDLNGDNVSEFIRVKYSPRGITHESAYVLYTSNVDKQQLDFSEQWLIGSTFFGDYNKDKRDEIYSFTLVNDSLFLYAAVLNAELEFFIKRQLILVRTEEDRVNDLSWDLRVGPGQMIDVDEDGFPDLLFTVVAGRSLKPRKVFVFSIKKRQIVAMTSHMAAHLSHTWVMDWNGDNQDEVIIRTSATANYPITAPYSDAYNWIFVFDKKLKRMLYSHQAPDPRQSYELPFRWQHNSFLIEIIQSERSSNLPHILVYDSQFQRIADTTLTVSHQDQKIIPFFISRHELSGEENNDRFMLLFPGEKIVELDPYLKVKAEHPFPFDVNGVSPLYQDLDLDGRPEIILTARNRIFIMADDLSEINQVYLSGYEQIKHTTLRKTGTAKPVQIAVQLPGQVMLLNYGANPGYPLRFLLFPCLFVVVWVSLFALFFIYRKKHTASHWMQFAMKSTSHGCLLLEANGQIRGANAGISDALGVREHIQRGQNVFQVFSHHPVFIQGLTKALTGGMQGNGNFLVHDKNGYTHTHFEILPIFGFFKIPLGYFVEVTNLDKMLSDERLQSWSENVRKMAHDIKSPLGSIYLNLETLKAKIRDQAPIVNKEIEPELQLMSSELSRLREMSKNFLKYLDIQKPQLNQVQLARICERMILRIYALSTDDIEFSVKIDPDAAQFVADESQIEIVMQILIENAVDAIKGKGCIEVSAQTAQYLDKSFHNYIEIEVSDTGCGISADILEKIFEPYFSQKQEGTGMGLPIAKRIIEAHGGELEVRSRRNFASTFRFMLPIRNMDENSIIS